MKTIVIFSFMIKDLNLKGAELLIYALIYSFSQFNQVCFMKPEKMASSLGLSRSQVFRSLSSLQKKELVNYNGESYFIYNREWQSDNVSQKLDEIIRLAKTPWLED